ncbi:MAG: HAD family hydrolase [Lachnospiraceae bacterium]|nr:HAD family hydrolase [Lachnospiraceae bacterium]MDY5742726.1 HAD family hydrolase [Lachnospiraceae bacterium]
MERIIFLDIDGTIRDFDGSIRPRTIQAVKAARAAGHKVFLATGRPGHQIEKDLIEIGFDGVVGSAGAFAEYRGECLYHEVMNTERLRELMQVLLRQDCFLFLQGVEKNFVLSSQAPLIRKWWQLPEGGSDLEREYFDCIDDLEAVGEIDKLIYFSDDLPHLTLRKEWGEDFNVLGLSFPGPLAYGAEIAPAGIDKVVGVRHVTEALGYAREAVVAIGDNENDIEMLRFAGVGIAMGNGTEEAKAAADLITEPLRDDGLFKAFVRLGLF